MCVIDVVNLLAVHDSLIYALTDDSSVIDQWLVFDFCVIINLLLIIDIENVFAVHDSLIDVLFGHWTVIDFWFLPDYQIILDYWCC